MSSTTADKEKQDLATAGRQQSEENEQLQKQLSRAENEVKQELEDDYSHQIKYRTCSWQKTAGLLFTEYIVLAIASFPWTYSVLGMALGIILTVLTAAVVLYTSLVLWEYSLLHPKLRDIGDIGLALFGGSHIVYWLTVIAFIINNTMIQGFHILTFSKVFNTLSDGGACTIAFNVVSCAICFLFSSPRTLAGVSTMGIVAASFMFLSVLLLMIFAGVEAHPADWDGTGLVVRAWPAKGTTFVDGFVAYLNILYTFVGHVIYPSFIHEMRNPRDFPKALYAVTVAEITLYVLCGAVVYHYVGDEAMVTPAYGALGNRVFKFVSFSMTIPTIIVVGVLYGSVSARFVFFRIFENSVHRYSHTVKGWTVWILLLLATWVGAFLIAELIPFFGDLLSLMSSLFDAWFGFIFWNVAYYHIYRGHLFDGPWRTTLSLFNLLLALFGLMVFGPGTYVSVDSIVLSYQSGLYGNPFTCQSNAI